MFTPEKLVKARVFCLKKDTSKAVTALYDFGTIHVSQPKELTQSKPLAEFRELSEKLVKLRALEHELSLSQAKAGKTAGANQDANHLIAKIDSLLNEKKALLEEKKQLEQKLGTLRPFKSFKTPASSLASHSGRLSTKCISVSSNQALSALKARFSYEFQDGFALLVFDSRDKGLIDEFVKKNNCLEFAIPKEGTSFEKDFNSLSKELSSLQTRLDKVLASIADFKAREGGNLVALRLDLEQEALKAELPVKFGESELMVLVEGWVPEKMFHELEKSMKSKIGKGICVEKSNSLKGMPSKMQNPRPLRPFEFLVRNLSLPKFDEIDPTFLVFLSFPLFFGMILGDIAYGIAMIAIALFLRSKVKDGFFRAASGMMVLSGLWTIFFGFVFGEFLGFEEVLGFHLTPLIHRTSEHGLLLLMQLSILVGLLHVLLGFAVGVASSLVGGHKKHALAKASWILVTIGLVGFLAASSDVELLGLVKQLAILPAQFFLYGLLAGLFGLIAFEGINALFELPGLVSNVVSYLRIMAIGVSGVILASMINRIPLSFSLEPMALLSFVLFALAFIIGHSFALVLGIFESSIQSLRLHYVEFFSKFYQGGGLQFIPLRNRGEKNGSGNR